MLELLKEMLGIKIRRPRWREEHYPIRKLISLIIAEAVQQNADRVSFGTPADGLKQIPLKSRAPETPGD